MNTKIYKLIAIGYLCIAVPLLFFFMLFCKMTFFHGGTGISNLFFNSILLFLSSWANWSFFSPLYKAYSEKRLKNKKEYELWYFLAVVNLLIAQKKDINFSDTKLWKLNGEKKYEEHLQ